MEWINPQSWIHIDVTGPDGTAYALCYILSGAGAGIKAAGKARSRGVN
jgi:hypothetical protein